MLHAPDQLLFIDIETVSTTADYAELDEAHRALWDHKAGILNDSRDPVELWKEKAGIYAEFGKVVCIGFGALYLNGERENCLRVKCLYGDDESRLLSDFAALLKKHYGYEHFLCGHNIREFDVPYLCRRMLIKGIALPDILDLGGKKPWEVRHIDTMQLWKFGDYKAYTPLKLLTHLFGIPSPKDELDGSMVGHAYWREKRLKDIANYCARDVAAVAQLYLRFQQEEIIPDERIEFVI